MGNVTRFQTIDSTYEVDWAGLRVREGADGQWRSVRSVSHSWGGLLIVKEDGESVTTAQIVSEEHIEEVAR
jgi:hypothetical protein